MRQDRSGMKKRIKDGNVEINAFKSIDGRFNCFDGSKSIQAIWVSDNECDCSDEPG